MSVKNALSSILCYYVKIACKNKISKLKQCSFKSFKIFYATVLLKPEICLLQLNQQSCFLCFIFKMKRYDFIYMQKEEIT